MKTLVTCFATMCILPACKKDQNVAPADSPETQLDAMHDAELEAGGHRDAGLRADDAVEIADKDAAGPLGYAVTDGALWVLTPPASEKADAPTGRKPVARVGSISWCEVDRASGLVWYHNDEGLQAYDTTTAKTHVVIKHPKEGEFEAVVIDYGGKAVPLQSEDGLSTDTAVKLTLGMAPKVEPHVLCEGDREVYCYDDQEDDDPKNWKLTEEVAAKLELAGHAKLDDAALAKTAYERALAYKPEARTTTPEPTPPKIKIDPSRCTEDPESCGWAGWVGGNFWLVTTDNSRGDFFHETMQLFDARSKEFVNPDGWLRSSEPFEEIESVKVQGSDDSRFAFIDGSLIDLRTGRNLWEGRHFAPCGWL